MRKTPTCILILLFTIGCAAHVRGPVFLESGVRFTYDAPSARSVALSGSFNQWDAKGYLLSGPDQRGVWSITIPLAPGRYEYAFIIDRSVWLPDPHAPIIDDGLGGLNSLLEVRE